MSDEKVGVNTVTSISTRLIMPGLIDQIYGARRLTPAEAAAARERREAEWDEKVAAGFVGINSTGGEDEDERWELAERGYWVQKWTTPDKWNVYLFARHLLDVAEEDL